MLDCIAIEEYLYVWTQTGEKMLETFFAVIASDGGTSIYKVVAEDEHGHPYAEKVFLQGTSPIAVGKKLDRGSMLAVCRRLIPFIPEGGGMTSFERRIEMVNTRYWGDSSSNIVALFTTFEEALAIVECDTLTLCDVRWLTQTRAILGLIGEDHPTFVVCHDAKLGLIESNKALAS